MSTTLTAPTAHPELSRLDLSRIAQDLQIRKIQVESVVQLLDEENTIPFITRYRKERTGGLDEEFIRIIKMRVELLRALAERKQTVLNSIEHQGKLSEELKAAILAADTPKRLEDLYLPYKPKKRSLASDARDKGLGPLAEAVWMRDPAVANLGDIIASMVAPEKGLNTPDDVLQGVGHILAEMIAESAETRSAVRYFLWDHSGLITAKSDRVKENEGLDYKDYFQFKEAVRTVPPHRTLAINRGEKEGVLTVKFDFDLSACQQAALGRLPLADHPHAEFLQQVGIDALSRLLLPSLEREIRRELTGRAEEHAVGVFARNLRSLLLAPPLRGRRVLAIDPAFRTGCKLAALDETGNLLEDAVVYPHQPQRKRADALIKLEEMVRKHQLQVIVIGNGTACRETEDVVAELLALLAQGGGARPPAPPPPEPPPAPPAPPPPAAESPAPAPAAEGSPAPAADQSAAPPPEPAPAPAPVAPPPPEPKPDPAAILAGLPLAPKDLAYIIINEAGASDYSASPIGKEEFPNFDATLRGTISIGRRLQDPLAELVKIDPQHVGVGLYQHDVDSKHLGRALEGVIESCVNTVGVDLNTASVPLLRYVSGLNQMTASNLVEFRKANGGFRSREQLMQVTGIGPVKYTQAAGFLKIIAGDEPLDQTWIHPESYAIARQLLQELGYSPDVITDREKAAELRDKLKVLAPEEVAARLNVGPPTCRDIIEALARPGRDPREDLPPPIFKKGILKLEDLQAGMELKGTVLNVVDFGAFVDIGLKDSGLVHISRMANRYVKSPYDVASVGDVVTVWVLSVDNERRRVSLTMIQPGTERKPQERRESRPPPREGREPRPPRQAQPPREAQAQGETPPQGQPRQQGETRPQGETRQQGEGRPQGESRPARGGRPQGEGRGQRDRRPQGGEPPPRGGRSLPPRGTTAKQRGQGRGPRPGHGGPPQGETPPAEQSSTEGAAAQSTDQAKTPGHKKRQGPKPSLSKEALAGKAGLGTFAELAAFWEASQTPPEPAKEPPPAEQPPPTEGEQQPPPA